MSKSLEWRWAEGKGAAKTGEQTRRGGTASAFSPVGVGM